MVQTETNTNRYNSSGVVLSIHQHERKNIITEDICKRHSGTFVAIEHLAFIASSPTMP
jgi:hypothetical protein